MSAHVADIRLSFVRGTDRFMSEYVVQCARFVLCEVDASSFHVEKVATGQWPIYTQIWTIAQVREAMAQGHCFCLESQDRTVRVQLECCKCAACNRVETLDTQQYVVGLTVGDLPRLP